MAAARTLTSGRYALDFHALYARLWALSDDLGDGTRLYISEGEKALKWLIAELAGTPAEAGRTLGHNNALRRQVYAMLVEEGGADRVNERKFRLLMAPTPPFPSDAPQADGREGVDEPVPLDDPDDEGVRVGEVPAGAVADDTGNVTAGGVEWSPWTVLAEAVRIATTSPGVYLARVGGSIVYVGMAGERRGMGVRGRLTVYARGRGAVSGLGEAVLDRALADSEWLTAKLDELRAQGPARAKEWAASAFDREQLDVTWSPTATAKAAEELERQILIELADAVLWNRARPRR
jgi:hypothetical protein